MFADLLAQPGVREELTLRSRIGFMALHGGSLERGTAEIAREAAAGAGASLYAVLQPEDLRWHIPSALVDPAESLELARFLDHVEVVVSIHGYGREDHWQTVLIGGSNRSLAARAARLLREVLPGYRVVDELDAIPPGLRGVHPDNPVNRARGAGIQIELPSRIRVRRLPERTTLVSALGALV